MIRLSKNTTAQSISSHLKQKINKYSKSAKHPAEETRLDHFFTLVGTRIQWLAL